MRRVNGVHVLGAIASAAIAIASGACDGAPVEAKAAVEGGVLSVTGRVRRQDGRPFGVVRVTGPAVDRVPSRLLEAEVASGEAFQVDVPLAYVTPGKHELGVLWEMGEPVTVPVVVPEHREVVVRGCAADEARASTGKPTASVRLRGGRVEASDDEGMPCDVHSDGRIRVELLGPPGLVVGIDDAEATLGADGTAVVEVDLRGWLATFPVEVVPGGVDGETLRAAAWGARAPRPGAGWLERPIAMHRGGEGGGAGDLRVSVAHLAGKHPMEVAEPLEQLARVFVEATAAEPLSKPRVGAPEPRSVLAYDRGRDGVFHFTSAPTLAHIALLGIAKDSKQGETIGCGVFMSNQTGRTASLELAPTYQRLEAFDAAGRRLGEFGDIEPEPVSRDDCPDSISGRREQVWPKRPSGARLVAWVRRVAEGRTEEP